MPKLRRANGRMQHEFEMTRIPGTNEVPRQRLIRAREVARRTREQALLRSSGLSLNWTERGPNNVAGRTRAILIDAQDPTGNTVFAAGVAGGLWKTQNFRNAFPTWTPIDDFFDNIAICALAQDPNDPQTIYFGTGEGWYNFDAVRGLGIWKTTDGGETWAQLSSTDNSQFYYIQDLVVDDYGHVYASTRDRGVMRSTNGGQDWVQVLGSSVGSGSTNRAADLEIGPDGSLYATLGIFSTGALWRSDHQAGNQTGAAGQWTEITPSGSFWRLELAIAPSDPNRLYLLCQGRSSHGVSALHRSDNAGQSWTELTVPGFCDAGGSSAEFSRNQAWYNLIAAVDPIDANRLYIGGVDALRSDDGGLNWTQITGWAQNRFNFCTGQSYVHADHHAIQHFPGQPDQMVWGTDGGLYYTLNARDQQPVFSSKNSGYNVTQFYSVALHPEGGTDYYLGGTQDNGTHRFGNPGMNATTEVTGGDGGFCHIDQQNPNIQITSYVYNNYYLSTNGGGNFVQLINNNSGRFINPSDYDNDAGKLYAAASSGEFFRWNNPREGGGDYDMVDAEFNGRVSAVFCDPNADNRVWMATNAPTALIRVDQAHLNQPSETTLNVPTELNGAYISSIHVLEGTPDRVLVTLSNYGVKSVWLVTNALSANPVWTDVEGNLPDMPVRWGLLNPDAPDQAILATELGVWTTFLLDGSATDWQATNDGLANVRVDMLQYRLSDGLVAAATHGRGLFTSYLSTGTPPPTPIAFFQEDFSDPSGWTIGGSNGGGDEQWTWQTNPQGIFTSQPAFAAPTAQNGFFAFNSDFNGRHNHDVTLTSGPIDCSAQDTIVAQFANQYAYFSSGGVSRPQLGVSTDGVNFVYFDVLQQVVRTSLSEANRTERVDITEVAAGASTVYLQFRWAGYWEYIWRVDDLTLLTFEQPEPDCPPERDILLDLYQATNGEQWFATWDTTSCNSCEWYGITCDEEQRITRIDLSGNNLTGELPASLAELTQLTTLMLTENNLFGCFPETWSVFCQQLTTAEFSGNRSIEAPDGSFSLFCELGQEACNPSLYDACSTATSVLRLEDPFISVGMHQAMDSVLIRGNLPQGDSATFRSGNVIVFRPGFHAHAGSTLDAYIAQCTAPEDQSAAPVALPYMPEAAPTPDYQLELAPNPFQTNTYIHYVLPEAASVQLRIFDAQGRQISQPYSGTRIAAGRYQLTFDGSQLPAGIYTLVLEVNSDRLTRRFVKS